MFNIYLETHIIRHLYIEVTEKRVFYIG